MRAPNRIKNATIAVWAASIGPAALGAGALHAEECLTDWGLAGEIVRRQKLLTVQQLMQSNAVGMPGQIVKTTLCKDGDDYIYKVVVRQASGQLKTVVVDARPGAAGSAGPGAAGADR